MPSLNGYGIIAIILIFCAYTTGVFFFGVHYQYTQDQLKVTEHKVEVAGEQKKASDDQHTQFKEFVTAGKEVDAKGSEQDAQVAKAHDIITQQNDASIHRTGGANDNSLPITGSRGHSRSAPTGTTRTSSKIEPASSPCNISGETVADIIRTAAKR